MAYHSPDLIGTFGKLTIIERADNTRVGSREKAYLCQCECGKFKKAYTSYLTKVKLPSCGCVQKKHKLLDASTEKEYNCWMHMKKRCLNEDNEDYDNYGGRGITIQESWIESFDNFLLDVGRCPNKGWTLDRIDFNGNYCKDNVRWADKYTQARNKRNNVLLTYNGQTKTLSEWASIKGFKPGILAKRLKRGWGIEKALTTKGKSMKEVIYEPFTFCG